MYQLKSVCVCEEDRCESEVFCPRSQNLISRHVKHKTDISWAPIQKRSIWDMFRKFQVFCLLSLFYFQNRQIKKCEASLYVWVNCSFHQCQRSSHAWCMNLCFHLRLFFWGFQADLLWVLSVWGPFNLVFLIILGINFHGGGKKGVLY